MIYWDNTFPERAFKDFIKQLQQEGEMAAPKKPNTKGGKSLKATKDPYIKGAGPTKFSASDCAMGDPNGKSMALGDGGRAAKLKAAGVPGGVIGKIARSKGVFGHMDFKKGPGKGKKGG